MVSKVSQRVPVTNLMSTHGIQSPIPADLEHLVNQFSMEGDTHGAEKKTRILVGGGAGVDRDVSTRDFLRGVPIH